jgi:LPXTG-motif cell wall-anchored protein
MKLRSALAAAAAATVVGPLALVSATVAIADPSGTPNSNASGTPSTTPSVTATPTATVTPTATPTTSSPTPTQTGTDEPVPSADPSEPDYAYCEDVDPGHDSKLSADIKGLPGRIVAGDGPHTFRLVVTNESAATIKNVQLYAEVENYELDEAKYLSPYVTLEFKDGKRWTRIGDGDWAGDDFLNTTLAADASTSVDLRLSIAADAPVGDAYSFGSGAYLDRVGGEDCIAEGWAQYDFEVLRPGSANPSPGTATPSDSDRKPQGGTTTTTSGNLASTGSSSALPVIGLVGGVAVVAGAGAVFAVRRRRAGSDA